MLSTLSSKEVIKIGIDGGDFVPFATVKSGIQRIVSSFIKEINQLKNNNFIFNYYYFGGKEKVKNQTSLIQFKKLPQKGFASIFLPFFFRKDKNRVFLGFSSNLPSLLNYSLIKKIIFLYDLGFIKYPQFYSNSKKLKIMISKSLKFADKIIVLSEYAKKEIEKHFFIDHKKKIICLYPGTDHLLKKNLIDQLIDFKYFLYVGVIKPIKNIEGLLKVFSDFLKQLSGKNYYLILIGAKEEKYFKNLLKNKNYQKIKERVIFLDNVSDKELINYYLQTEALLNFSLEEGFCFPVMEALSLGKKVIVNNLAIYDEFKNKFNNLLIGKNEREIVKLMFKTAVEKNNRVSPKKIFFWHDFAKRLLTIIKKN